MLAMRYILHLAPVTLLLTACNSTAPVPSQRISLSATIGSAATPSASGPLADVIVSGTNGKVRITSAQVVLSHIELKSDAACTTDASEDATDANDATDATAPAATGQTDAENNDEHDCEVHLDPVLVSLPMDGTTKVILDALVPAGTYSGLRAKLEAVEGDDAGASAFLAANPDFADISVKVAGVFTDAGGTDHAFTFTSKVGAELEMNFASPVTVGASTSNLTVDVDVSTWFKDASGGVIDPTNAANQEAIEAAIRASLRAFEDDNHDGHDDHEGEGGH
jgi:hypothetical protein